MRSRMDDAPDSSSMARDLDKFDWGQLTLIELHTVKNALCMLMRSTKTCNNPLI